jgi:hypothetical protein
MKITIELTYRQAEQLRQMLEQTLHIAEKSHNVGTMLGVDTQTQRAVEAVLKQLPETIKIPA